jgi:pimeloyl-ACP methyl ester carboxylesterase
MKLTVHTTGSGSKSVALFHGISGEAAMFADLTQILADRFDYTVYGVDLRGHGDSPRADSYSLPELADDVVDSLPTGLDLVMGHSLGGRVLLDSVGRLLPRRAVYLDPALRVASSASVTAGRANVGEHEDGSPFSTEELTAANPGWGPANIERARTSHSHWDASMFEQLMSGVAEANAPAGTPAVPSLILLAENSPLIDASFADELSAVGWEVRVQKGAGHNLHLDDVDKTIRMLDGWI